MDDRRGYSREADERRTPRRRPREFCDWCDHPLARDQIAWCGRCDRNYLDAGDPFAGCVCSLGAEDFPNGRSVCGWPCPVHAPKKKERACG